MDRAADNDLPKERESPNGEKGITPLFDNPLTQKILTKEDVASIFRKSLTWVSRMMACGRLPHHYVGDTAMFYAEEILQAFLNDSLAKPRRSYDAKEKKQEWAGGIRGRRDGTRPQTLQEIRLSSGRTSVD